MSTLTVTPLAIYGQLADRFSLANTVVGTQIRTSVGDPDSAVGLVSAGPSFVPIVTGNDNEYYVYAPSALMFPQCSVTIAETYYVVLYSPITNAQTYRAENTVWAYGSFEAEATLTDDYILVGFANNLIFKVP